MLIAYRKPFYISRLENEITFYNYLFWFVVVPLLFVLSLTFSLFELPPAKIHRNIMSNFLDFMHIIRYDFIN